MSNLNWSKELVDRLKAAGKARDLAAVDRITNELKASSPKSFREPWKTAPAFDVDLTEPKKVKSEVKKTEVKTKATTPSSSEPITYNELFLALSRLAKRNPEDLATPGV